MHRVSLPLGHVWKRGQQSPGPLLNHTDAAVLEIQRFHIQPHKRWECVIQFQDKG